MGLEGGGLHVNRQSNLHNMVDGLLQGSVVFLFACGARGGGVLDSQFVGLWSALAATGMRPELLGFDGPRAWLPWRKDCKTDFAPLRQQGARPLLFMVPWRSRTARGLLGRMILSVVVSIRCRGALRPVFHCRGTLTTLTASTVKYKRPNARVILDLRGLEGAELLYHTQETGQDPSSPQVQARYRIVEEREREAVFAADHILCVSHAFKSLLIEKYQLSEEQIDVIPCTSDPHLFYYDPVERAMTRERMGLEDKLVVVYSGSLSWAYQLPAEMARAFSLLHRDIPSTHLLVLTSDVTQARQVFGEFLHRGVCTTLAVPHHEVRRYLNAADVGLLLRRDDLTNRVASPVKLAEYLMTGLPVVLTPWIGDVLEFARQLPTALLFTQLGDMGDLVSAVQRLRASSTNADYRQQVSQIAKQIFSREAYIPLLLAVYLGDI